MEDQNTNIDEHLRNSLINILAPEVLDSNKIITTLGESLEANVDDIFSIPDINKLFEGNKEKFVEISKTFDFVFIDHNSSFKYDLNNNTKVISLVNIPINWKKENILENISILSKYNSNIKRLYKKSIFWHLVIDKSEIADIIEEDFLKNEYKNLNDLKVKFERISYQEIKKRILKHLITNTYQKETIGLKSNNNNNQDNTSKLSWRKKSNDTTDDFKKGSKAGKNSGTFQRSFLPQGGIRDRYHSDGQQSIFRPNTIKRAEEIEIDLSKIHYSLKIKHKYSNADVLLFYDKYRINKTFEKPPKFENYIDDVCSKDKRKEFNFLKRERSLTYSMPYTNKNNKYDEVKLNLDAPAFKIPLNNPLSGGAKLSGIQLNK